MKSLVPIMFAAIIGGLAGGMIAISMSQPKGLTQQELMKNFYLSENAVRISPHTLRKRMDKQDHAYILVDVRSPQEYEKEHITGAVNIPAYKDPNTSIALDTDSKEKKRIIDAFRALPKGKEVIVYCYSTACMTGRKIGKLLAENDIFVKHLGIGWNEWRYSWNLWNHDGETPTKVEDYLTSGKEPGTPKAKEIPSPCGAGELGC